MLYEVITEFIDLASDGDYILAGTLLDGEIDRGASVQPCPTGLLLRITSYNVCYTKLLRG